MIWIPETRKQEWIFS